MSDIVSRVALLVEECNDLRAWKVEALREYQVRTNAESAIDLVLSRHPEYLGWNRYEALAELVEKADNVLK